METETKKVEQVFVKIKALRYNEDKELTYTRQLPGPCPGVTLRGSGNVISQLVHPHLCLFCSLLDKAIS